MNNIWIFCLIIHLFKLGQGIRVEKTIKGSSVDQETGFVEIPKTFSLKKNYIAKGDTYIYVFENTEEDGAVSLYLRAVHLHPESILTIRDGQFGGYLGKLIGRYDAFTPPPPSVSSQSCCLRLEFSLGCCRPAYPGAKGIEVEYRFIFRPGRGRSKDCSKEKVLTLFCNGECLPQIDSCPLSAIIPDQITKRSRAFVTGGVIMATAAAFLLVAAIAGLTVCVSERRKNRKKEGSFESAVSTGCIINNCGKGTNECIMEEDALETETSPL